MDYISVQSGGWMSAAANMKALRKERSWSQAGEAGLDRTYVSGIERKVKNPTVTVVERLAKALGCKLGDLLDQDVSFNMLIIKGLSNKMPRVAQQLQLDRDF